MKIEGQHTLEAPRDVVWEALLDPEVISRTLPGCEGLTKLGENQYQGSMNVQVGPVQGQFEGTVTLLDLDPPQAYRLKLKGQGASGFVEGEGEIRLEEEGGGTRLTYAIDARVGGRVASVGQRLLDSTARVITRQSLEHLNGLIKARHQAQQGEASLPVPEAPSQTRFAAGVARGVLADLVPPERRPLILAVGVCLILVVILLAYRFWG